mgnify:CR=1 FL=1
MRSVAIDFETEAIDGWRPPEPVGLAIAHSTRAGKYYGWGHQGHNNSTKSHARERLRRVAYTHRIWCFNAGFDIPVARLGMDLPIPWDRVCDAQILAFLGNPLARARSLKGLCESELGVAPGERDALYRWIQAHVPEARRLGTKRLGAYISRAPCDQVAPYARVDVLDVLRLRDHWAPLTRGPAWEREHAMLPVLNDMRVRGIPINRRLLARDAKVYEGWLVRCEGWLLARLGIRELKPSLVVAACERLGMTDSWYDTATGPSLAKEHLNKLVAEGNFKDATFVAVWSYRLYLAWALQTFVRVWLASGEDSIHPTWSGVLGDAGGAVTGRLSSRPNAQNLPKRVPVFDVPADLGVGPLPNLREYIEAPAGWALVGIDVSQQELRILGHFEPTIGDMYRGNPRIDLHVVAMQKMSEAAGVTLDRDTGKATNLTTIYGGGAPVLSDRLGITEDQARTFKAAHAKAFPGIAKLRSAMELAGRYETAGGRWYESVSGKAYRDINYRIQGSAADQLKAIMLEAHAAARSMGGWIPLTAHDEILTCVPTKRASEMRSMLTELVESTGVGKRNAMFDVPMLGETYQGKRWLK